MMPGIGYEIGFTLALWSSLIKTTKDGKKNWYLELRSTSRSPVHGISARSRKPHTTDEWSRTPKIITKSTVKEYQHFISLVKTELRPWINKNIGVRIFKFSKWHNKATWRLPQSSRLSLRKEVSIWPLWRVWEWGRVLRDWRSLLLDQRPPASWWTTTRNKSIHVSPSHRLDTEGPPGFGSGDWNSNTSMLYLSYLFIPA